MLTRLFVGNLPYNATENDLKVHFGQAGVVLSINMMVDRQTGRSRGFSFVDMDSKVAATKSIEMFHGQDFQGRNLTVNEARPREERPPSAGDRGAHAPR